MKKKLLYTTGLSLAILMGITSCSSDYLETKPITSIGDKDAVSTTKTAQMSIYGISRIMYSQLSTSAPRANSGEASMGQEVNEIFGPDNTSYFLMGETGKNWYTWDVMTQSNATRNASCWNYCYMLIARANTILASIDEAEGTQAERDWIKAQAYTYRAFGYLKALQWFAPRWEDSNNGQKYAVVLRTEPGTAPAPLATMNEVIDLMYSDLTSAIDLYKSSKMTRTYIWEPGLEIAYGIFARIAMIKHDWTTAQTMAHNARKNGEQEYPVLSNAGYMSGFIAETEDCMWTNWDNDIYWSTYGAWYSCNGHYPSNWSRGFSINVDLYNALDPKDIRRQCFFMPDKAAEVAKIKGYEDVTATMADFYKADNVAEGTMNMIAGGLKKFAQGFVKYAQNNLTYTGRLTSLPYTNVVNGTVTSMQFGAQVKMWSIGDGGTYNDSKYPWMRATEMLLTEAEAAYMAGDMATAKSCIEELNKLRIPGYVAPEGEALLNDIRLSRRIELWGEGHNFTDFKRWNIPASERKWTAGDITSGNTPANYASTHQPSDCKGWRLAIPDAEEDFNSAFDRSLLN